MNNNDRGGPGTDLVAYFLPKLVVIGGAVALMAYCTAPVEKDYFEFKTDATTPPLTAKEIAGCTQVIRKSGLVRQWPEPYRVNVDEIRWAGMPSSEKVAFLALLACHTDGRRLHEMRGGDFVSVHGYHTGRRLAGASEAGTLLE